MLVVYFVAVLIKCKLTHMFNYCTYAEYSIVYTGVYMIVGFRRFCIQHGQGNFLYIECLQVISKYRSDKVELEFLDIYVRVPKTTGNCIVIHLHDLSF